MNILEMNYADLKRYIYTLSKKEIVEVLEVLKMDSRKNVKELAMKLMRNIEKENKECLRVKALYDMDISFGAYEYIAGVDEVGRGPLAGPIVAAAVILDLKNTEEYILKINDSKKLSEKVREELSSEIKAKAISYHFALLDNTMIDEKGISFCNNEIFTIACMNLAVTPQLILSDGYGIKNLPIKNEFLIKGDSKSASIAAASIIAKTYRDNLMKEYAKIYPQYGFEKNAGYGTEEHINAIKKYGYTKLHRMSFLKNIILE